MWQALWMARSSHEWFADVSAAIERDGHRPWEPSGWSTWPFDEGLRVRQLHRPQESEPGRRGAGGIDCFQCEQSARPDPGEHVFWRDELAMLGVPRDRPRCRSSRS